MGITSCCFPGSIQLINIFLEGLLSLDVISQGGGKIIPEGVWEVSGFGAGWWFSDNNGSAGWTVGLNDLKGLSKLDDSIMCLP